MDLNIIDRIEKCDLSFSRTPTPNNNLQNSTVQSARAIERHTVHSTTPKEPQQKIALHKIRREFRNSVNRAYPKSSRGPRENSSGSSTKLTSFLNSNISPKESKIMSQDEHLTNLYKKITDASSQQVYEPADYTSYTPNRTPESRIAKGSLPSATRKTPNVKNIFGKGVSRTGSLPETPIPHIPPDSNNVSPRPNRENRRIEKSNEPYKYSRADSKFFEILELKSRNQSLIQENLQLKNDLEEIDEFDEVLMKKTKIEDFNEKRCDILKACIHKQKRYIDYQNKAIRMSKLFYKELRHVFDFLKELDHKYMHSKYTLNQNQLEKLESTSSQMNLAYRSLSEIQAQLGNTTAIKAYIANFNEAYSQLVHFEEKNFDFENLFEIAPASLSLEEKKKLKYKYALKNFVNKHKHLFPIYTVFNDFELKDKTDFSTFLKQIEAMADKISTVFSKLKNFDMLSHVNFFSKDDIPEIVKHNKVELQEYFSDKNPNKRIILNGHEINKAERSLSDLLNQLIHFHNALAVKKDDISLESILQIQNTLRSSIENLLLLGITTTCDLDTNDKILVITKRNPQGDVSDFLRSGYIPEKETLFEIYNQEADRAVETTHLKNQIKKLFDELSQHKQETDALQKLKAQVELLQVTNQELGVISRLKDVEMNFTREYARIALTDIDQLKEYVDKKVHTVDSFLKQVDKHLKDMDESFEVMFQDPKELKNRIQFHRKFKTTCKEIRSGIFEIISKQKNSVHSSLGVLQEAFQLELSKIKKELLKSGNKIREIEFKIKKIR